MNNCIEKIESSINNFLLRDIIFVHNSGKILKRGKLILFRFKDFHFNFTLENAKGEFKIYEIPYPFVCTNEPGSIMFSYEVENFAVTDDDLLCKIHNVDKSTSTKLYNSTVVLSGI